MPEENSAVSSGMPGGLQSLETCRITAFKDVPHLVGRPWGYCMTIDPGDILEKVRIERIDYIGNAYFTVKGQPCYILPKDAPKTILQENSVLDRVVCLGIETPKRGLQCSAGEYLSKVIQSLYKNRQRYERPFIKDSRKNVWIKRWCGVADKPESVQCSDVLSPEDTPKTYNPTQGKAVPLSFPGKEWRVLVSDKWEMPVLAPDVMSEMDGEPLFCPTALTPLGDDSRVGLSPCYKTGASKNDFPLFFNGEMKTTGSTQPGRVKIYLHGYLNPRKWHHNIWKHLLAASPSLKGDHEDSELWKGLLANKSDGTDEGLMSIDHRKIEDIFEKCEETDSSRRLGNNPKCKPCSKAVFSKVNNQIIDLMQGYLKQIVILFKSNATKTLKIRRSLYEGINDIEVYLSRKVRFSRDGREFDRWHFVVLRGFIFNCGSHDQIIHIAPVTQYLSQKNKQFKTIPGLVAPIRGEISDVKPSKPI